MVIQTLDRGFSVTRILKSSENVDILLCRNLLEEEQDLNQYTIICLKNSELIYKTIPFFVGQKNNSAFDDFVECFSQGGNFYVVFRYYEKPLFKEKMETGEYTLIERLQICKSLMSRITIENMPSCIQYEVLQPKNLLLDESLTVNFNYFLEEVEIYHKLSIAQMQTELAGVFRIAFEGEIATKVCPELLEFLDMLEMGSFSNYLEMYQAYNSVYAILKDLIEVGKVEPKSFLFRLWEWIKKIFRLLKPALAALILIAAFGYLVYTVSNPTATEVSAVDSKAGTYIEQIGTVKIK